MKWLILAVAFLCVSNSAFANPCEFEFENIALSRIRDDSVLKPLAQEWLKLNHQAQPSDERFLKVTYWYLIFVAELLNQREASNGDPKNNPYVTFLKNLFQAKQKKIDVTHAIDATSKFLDGSMTSRGLNMRRLEEIVEAVQKYLVPEMARLQIELEFAKDGDAS